MEEYLRTWNGTDAYKAAYPKCTRETARINASKLLTATNIKAEIDKRLSESAMSADEVLERLGRQARGSHESWIRINDDGFISFDFSNPETAKHLDLIKKIKTKRTRRIEGKGNDTEEWEDEWVEVELYDAQAALALLGKHHKLFNERVDHSGNIVLYTSDQASALIANIFSTIQEFITDKEILGKIGERLKSLSPGIEKP